MSLSNPAMLPFEGRGRAPRCPRCAMLVELCFCAEVRLCEVRTRVVVVMHHGESHRSTNSGRLAALALRGAEVRLAARPASPLEGNDLNRAGSEALLLFPSADSVELGPRHALQASLLVVPDGSWRQARRLVAREPCLSRIAKVHLPAGPPSRYRLRRHPDKRFLATFEAIARALGVLEGAEVQAELERVFDILVERSRRARGLVADG